MKSKRKVITVGVVLAVTLLMLPSVLPFPSSFANANQTNNSIYKTVEAYYNHPTGLFTAHSIQFNFTHVMGGTVVSLTPLGANTPMTVLLINQTPQGYTVANYRNLEQHALLTKQNGSSYDPSLSYSVSVVDGGADPDPSTGSTSGCGATWSSETYTVQSGELELTWNGPTWTWFPWSFTCLYGFFYGGSWSVSGFGFPSIGGALGNDVGSTTFQLPSQYWSGGLAVGISWDYQAITP